MSERRYDRIRRQLTTNKIEETNYHYTCPLLDILCPI